MFTGPNTQRTREGEEFDISPYPPILTNRDIYNVDEDNTMRDENDISISSHDSFLENYENRNVKYMQSITTI